MHIPPHTSGYKKDPDLRIPREFGESMRVMETQS